MTHETAVLLSQIVSTSIFATVFAGVVVYAFWPGNKKKFSEAAAMPLDFEANAQPKGDAS